MCVESYFVRVTLTVGRLPWAISAANSDCFIFNPFLPYIFYNKLNIYLVNSSTMFLVCFLWKKVGRLTGI